MDNRLRALLNTLRERPGVYIGGKILGRLVSFSCGYVQCLFELEGKMPIFLQGFQQFVEEYYGLQDISHVFQGWSKIIEFFSPTEEIAFDRFYMLVDLFLTQKGEEGITSSEIPPK